MLELVDDLDHVVARDAEGVGHLRGGAAAVGAGGRVDEHAEGVVREQVKLHVQCNFIGIGGRQARTLGPLCGRTAFGGGTRASRGWDLRGRTLGLRPRVGPALAPVGHARPEGPVLSVCHSSSTVAKEVSRGSFQARPVSD